MIDNNINEIDYRELIRVIKSIDIDYKGKDDIIRYVHNIKSNRRINDFFEFDFLYKVIVRLISTKDDSNHYYVMSELEKIITIVKYVLPLGVETEHYDTIKNMIVNNFVDNEKMREVFNFEFYSLFDSVIDYLQIMNIIAKKENPSYKAIYDFGIEMAKEIEDQSLLKREIINYIYNYGELYGPSDKDYLEDRIEKTRMKYGIYSNLDERSIAGISRDIKRMNSILKKLDSLERRVDGYVKTVDSKTKGGLDEINSLLIESKNEIASYKKDAIIKMQNDLNSSKQELLDELNKYMISLEDTMKNNSDKVFNQILLDAKEKLEQIRVVSNNLAGTSMKEILKIQTETQNSLDKLKEYVERSPELQSSLKVAKDSEDFMNALIAFNANKEKILEAASSPVVAGNPTIITTADNFLVPKYTMVENILPAFDRTRSFDSRMKEIEKRIKELESRGYIIPPAIYEALPWYLIGKKIVYFYGPTQSGKTTVAELLAKVADSELLDGGKITEEHSITSYNDVRGIFDENALFYALYYGKTIFYDELDNGNPDNLVVLGTFASKLVNKIDKPDKEVLVQFAKRRFVPINANARIIAAGNTSGKGRNREYTARSKMDESSLERMVPIFVDYNDLVEEKIFGRYTEWYEFFKLFRQFCNEWATQSSMDNAEGNVTTGDASTIVECIKEKSVSLSQLIRAIFIQTKEEDYISYLCNEFEQAYCLDEEYDLSKINNINKHALDKINAKSIAMVFCYECRKSLNDGKKLVR